MLAIDDRTDLAPEARVELDRVLAGFSSLEDVVRWAFSEKPPRNIADVVVQDEFSHDVILGWREIYLVFDTT